MVDKEDAAKEEGGTNSDASGAVHSSDWTGEDSVAAEQNPEIAGQHQGIGHRPRRNYISKLWQGLNTPEKISALASVAAVVVAIASVTVAWQTRVVMDRQLSEMQSSGVDTHNLVVATQNLDKRSKAQADALDKLRKAGEDQAKATGDLKDITKGQADKIAGLYGAIKASADAAKAQSKATQAEAESVRGQTAAVEKTLHATQDMADAMRTAAKASENGNAIANRAFLAAERPWVGVSSSAPSGKPQVGQDFTVIVEIKNTGRSPALNSRALFVATLHDEPDASGAPLQPCPQRACSSLTLLPNGTAQYNPGIAATALTKAEVDNIENGKSIIFVVGRIDYQDDTALAHWTAFCSYWNVLKAGMSSCTGGNDAN